MQWPQRGHLGVTVRATSIRTVRIVSTTLHTATVSDRDESWMHRLVDHYRQMRRTHPDDELVVVFDIDGTIIDTRHLIRHTLLTYDRVNGTDHFRGLRPDDITVHEAEVVELLEHLDVPTNARAAIVDFYAANLWSQDSLLAAHRPYRGVMEVMRWFQLQHRTSVVLNTGRPESIRRPTLHAMNELGREYRVTFRDDQLLMNPGGWGEAVTDAKVAALEHVWARGMRVVAVVDNEPENLGVMALADTSGEVLFLHASTIFLSARRPVPRSVSGDRYDLHAFVSESELQGHVQLVWDDVTDRSGLERWLLGSVGCVGVPVRLDPYGRPEVAPRRAAEYEAPSLDLNEVLHAAADAGRSVRLDLSGPLPLVEQTLTLVDHADLTAKAVWFNGEFHVLGERGIRTLRSAMPEATISCPVDFLAPLVFGALEHAIDVLDVLRSWGVDRLGVGWGAPRVRDLVAELEAWGREVDVFGIDDPEELLQAALLLPRSVTASAASFRPGEEPIEAAGLLATS